MKWALMAFVLVSLHVSAAEASLEMAADKERLSLSQSQLLSRHDLQTLSITDSEYKQQFTKFKAIPIANLLNALPMPEFAVIQFNGSDGFSANLEKARLFSADPKASKAFLAIEDPDHPWPKLEGKATSAGPFYLVWMNPQASGIGPEEWPYGIVSIRILSDARNVFPNIFPAADAMPNVQNGLRSFRKNCFACHKMNGNGTASIGPDLNLPRNPTEYFDTKALTSLIRNPASVRIWPAMVMRGFPQAVIPDTELADLISYLEYMSAHQVNP